jgi:hypothetical protein
MMPLANDDGYPITAFCRIVSVLEPRRPCIESHDKASIREGFQLEYCSSAVAHVLASQSSSMLVTHFSNQPAAVCCTPKVSMS